MQKTSAATIRPMTLILMSVRLFCVAPKMKVMPKLREEILNSSVNQKLRGYLTHPKIIRTCSGAPLRVDCWTASEGKTSIYMPVRTKKRPCKAKTIFRGLDMVLQCQDTKEVYRSEFEPRNSSVSRSVLRFIKTLVVSLLFKVR